MARRARPTTLSAPFLRGIRLRDDTALSERYPFNLPWLTEGFAFRFDQPVTIFAGENGAGKSTLVEAIAALAGFRLSGGGAWAGYGDVGGEEGGEAATPAALAAHLRASWRPKVARGWFLRAGSFETVAAELATDPLVMSHGEGVIDLISTRMQGQGVFLLDEPEAALSPLREVELLRFLAEIQARADAQVILATHAPLLMAVPGAALWRMSHRGLDRVSLRDMAHFRLYRAFGADPEGFVAAALAGEIDNLV